MEGAPLRVALVTRAISWEGAGGGEVLVRLLAEGLARMGHHVSVVAVDARGVPPEKAPFRLLAIPDLSVLAIRGALQEVQPQVVDAHNMESAVPTLLAARSLGIPTVVTVNSAWPACLFADMYRPGHGVCVSCSVGGVRDCFEKRPAAQIGTRVPALVGYAEVQRRLLALRLARRLVAHSEASKDLLTRNGLPAERIRVVPNFDEPALHRDAAPDPEAERIVCVGALTRTKGVDVLLEAFAILAPRRPRARLQLAGQGFLRDELEKRARELGVADRVDLLGYVPHERVGELYRKASAAAFVPVSEEAFGRAIFEAWGSGVPLVAARISAPGEVVRDGETGLLVPPGDPRALADALERVLADEVLAARLAQAGREALEAYAPERVIPRFVDVYREAMA